MSEPRPRIEDSLRITLLGPPDIRWTAPLTLARRQTRALLYRLAASQQPVSRDELGTLLAGQATEHASRRAVTVVLNQLRSALPCPEALEVHDDAIGLDRQLIRTDIATFNASTAGTARLDDLAAGVELYRGPFLHGFAYDSSADWDDWLLRQRRYWERRYLDALTAMADQHTARRDFRAARTAVERYLAVDELDEAMQRRLMALYAAVGDRAAALRQFERCVIALERELGAAPQPETRAMYEAVRDGHSPLDGGPIGASAAGAAHSAPATPSRVAPAAAAAPPSVGYLARSALPASSTPLLGRDGELDATAELLATNTRLLTLCGPGGAGKTRLALELAARLGSTYRDGVVWVALASLGSAAMLPDTIVQAFGLVSTRALPPARLLQMFLGDKQLLLVLDNLEHLPGAAPLLAELLAAAPGLTILATSRTPLKLHHEQLFAVRPLPLPSLACLPPLGELAQQPAVALLVARARQQQADFRLVEENAAELAAICVRLGGLPLALELAAARLALLSPRELLRRLDRRLDLLAHGPRELPERNRTLRGAIAWSEQLLDRRTRHVFEALAVFRGGWTPHAAAAVTDAPNGLLAELQSLHEAHLIVSEPAAPDTQRFDMLETIRQYAGERLANSAAVAAVRHNHAAYFVAFAEARASRLHGPLAAEVLCELDRDYANIRAALDWSLETGEQVFAARLVSALQWYWDTRGLLGEGRSWNARIRLHAASLPRPLSARIRSQAAFLAYRQGDTVEAEQLAASVLADAHTAAEDRVDALCTHGLLAMQRAEYGAAREPFERALALATRAGLRLSIADAQANLGMLLLSQGHLDDAEVCLQNSFRAFAQLHHVRYRGSTLGALGYIAVLRGKAEQAGTMLREAAEHLKLVGEIPYVLYVLMAFAELAALRKQPLLAATLSAAASTHAGVVGLRFITGVGARSAGDGHSAADGKAGALEQAERRGRALSLDGALALALGQG